MRAQELSSWRDQFNAEFSEIVQTAYPIGRSLNRHEQHRELFDAIAPKHMNAGYLAGGTLALLGSEWLTRRLGIEPLAGRSINQYFWITDPKLGFRNRPNGRFRYRSMVGKPCVTTDAFGFRNGIGWNPEGNEPVVVFLGDSTTFCGEVNDHQTVVSEVATRILTKFPAVRCLNAAVRGYGTLQCKRMLVDVLATFPVKIVVYVACWNDIYQNLNPITHFPAYAPYATWNEQSGEIAEQQELDGIETVSSKSVFSTPRSLRGTSRLLWHVQSRSALLSLVSPWIPEAILSRGLYLHPSGMFGPLRTAKEWNTFRKWALERGAIQVFHHLLREMYQICAKRRVSFLGSAFALSEADSSGFDAHFSHAAIPFIDARSRFVRPVSDYCARKENGELDGHFNALGTSTFADALAPSLSDLLGRVG